MMRKSLAVLVALACTSAVEGPKPARADSPIQTQLRGISSMSISVFAIGPNLERLTQLEELVTAVAQAEISQAEVAIDPKAVVGLVIEIDIRRFRGTACSEDISVALIDTKLIEPITLARDPTLRLPAGGGVTWSSSRMEQLENSVEKGVLAGIEQILWSLGADIERARAHSREQRE